MEARRTGREGTAGGLGPVLAACLLATFAACGDENLRFGTPGPARDPGIETVDAPDGVGDDGDLAVRPDDGEETDPGTGSDDRDLGEAPDDAQDAPDDVPDAPPGDPASEVPDAPAADLPDAGPDTAAPGCHPDSDGVLAPGEVPVLLGAAIRYLVRAGDGAPIPDLAGTPCPAGLCWDFSAPVAGDVEEVDVVKPASAHWFGAGFPDDAFVVNLEPGMLAVYRKTADTLWMLGMASEADGDDRTRLAYDPPVPILRLPLRKSDAYEVETEASGRYGGQDYPLDYGLMGKVQVFHRYRFLANGEGQAKVPLGTFRVVRLLLDLRMEVRNSLNPVPLATQRFKVYDFLAECLGLVARVRSVEGEAATFFGTATEYRRMGF